MKQNLEKLCNVFKFLSVEFSSYRSEARHLYGQQYILFVSRPPGILDLMYFSCNICGNNPQQQCFKN